MKYYKVFIDSKWDGNISAYRPAVVKELYNKYARMIIINGELFTPREYEQLQIYYNFTPEDFMIVHWKKKRTGFIFGKRMQLTGGEQ